MKRFMYFLLGMTIAAALVLSCGCAGKNLVNRDQFMERAEPFDAKYKSHPMYDECLQRYMVCLLNNCYELAEEAKDEYWTCAWDCLDEAEVCVNEG